MAYDNSGGDKDNVLFAEKRAILAIIFIVLALLAYIMVKYIQTLLPANSVQPSTALPQGVSAQQTSSETSGAVTVGAQEVAVAFLIDGRIAQMFFTPHTRVRKGDVLATLQKVPFEDALASAKASLQAAQEKYDKPVTLSDSAASAIEEARANVETAQYTYDTAHAELEKRKSLLVAGEKDNVYDNDVQNEHDAALDLDRMRRELKRQQDIVANNTDRAMDKANVQIAQNNVAIAQTNLMETQLLSPIDGVVVSHAVDVGDNISVGAVVYVLSVSGPADSGQ